MTTQDPKPMVLQLLDSIERELKLVETVCFKVARGREKRFLDLVGALISDSTRTPGIMTFNLHKCLQVHEPHTEYLLCEVWRDRDALRKQWESDFLKIFHGKLVSENVLVTAPELKFFQYDRVTDKNTSL